MQKTIHKTRDKNHARRLTAILMLHRGDRVSDVARTLCCVRSSVGRWINWFTLSGAEGLISLPAGRARHWLPAAGLVWRMAAPTLRIRDPYKAEKMAAIHEALDKYSAENPVIYEDEVDIHLNLKIGAAWQARGQQKRVVTPGQNEKYYLVGALHSGTGKVNYVGGSSKSSILFISLLKHFKATYRRAKTITLIVDNYIIHKKRETQRWLRQLLKKVCHFMETASPFPGGKHGLAKV
jgi:transposase